MKLLTFIIAIFIFMGCNNKQVNCKLKESDFIPILQIEKNELEEITSDCMGHLRQNESIFAIGLKDSSSTLIFKIQNRANELLDGIMNEKIELRSLNEFNDILKIYNLTNLDFSDLNFKTNSTNLNEVKIIKSKKRVFLKLTEFYSKNFEHLIKTHKLMKDPTEIIR